MITALHLSDIRCFRGPRDLPLRPLTVLVGENSSGKSTVLGLVRLAYDLLIGERELDLNEEPFQLGGFADLAHYHGGQGKRASTLEIGLKMAKGGSAKAKRHLVPVEFSAVLEAENGHFAATSGSLRFDDRVEVALTRDGPEPEGLRVAISNPDEAQQLPGMIYSEPIGLLSLAKGYILFAPDAARAQPAFARDPVLNRLRDEVQRWALARYRSMKTDGRPYALAPVRTRPLRTYDPIRNRPDPEGGHVPALLSRLIAAGGAEGIALIAAIRQFGEDSGLFTDLRVKRLGRPVDTAPFQILVKVAGQSGERNLLDVGYGVSQVLPILCDVLTAPSRTILLQQPEVHLHPQAQAALGTFLAGRLGADRQLIVETHSDYLLDRVSMSVRRGTIRPEDVVILFFEPGEDGVQVHPITLDGQGNVLGAPPGYRRFFIEEQRRFLFGDVSDR